MYKAGSTDLEYNEADKVALEYYMGGETESHDDWADRVSEFCSQYQSNNGLDNDGNKLPSVYANSLENLWENKKKRRREAISKVFSCECTDEAIEALALHENYVKSADKVI